MVPERDCIVENPCRQLGTCVGSKQDLRLSPWTRTGSAGMLGLLVDWDAFDVAEHMS